MTRAPARRVSTWFWTPQLKANGLPPELAQSEASVLNVGGRRTTCATAIGGGGRRTILNWRRLLHSPEDSGIPLCCGQTGGQELRAPSGSRFPLRVLAPSRIPPARPRQPPLREGRNEAPRSDADSCSGMSGMPAVRGEARARWRARGGVEGVLLHQVQRRPRRQRDALRGVEGEDLVEEGLGVL